MAVAPADFCVREVSGGRGELQERDGFSRREKQFILPAGPRWRVLNTIR